MWRYKLKLQDAEASILPSSSLTLVSQTALANFRISRTFHSFWFNSVADQFGYVSCFVNYVIIDFRMTIENSQNNGLLFNIVKVPDHLAEDVDYHLQVN